MATSDAYGELNQDRDIGTKINTKGLQALDDVFVRLREFIMAKRKPLHYEETLAALPGYLDQEPSRSLLVLAFQRVGLELVHVAPTDLVISAAEPPQNIALHDLEALAQYVHREFLRMGKTVCTFSLWDGGELIAYAPEARATVYAGLRMQSPDTEGSHP